MNYNLLEEEWLPVLWKNGVTNRVGIIEALTQAHRIRQIAASNPMDRVAILRFLLALLYWCKWNTDDVNAPPGGSIPEEWINFLNNHKQLFDLIGDQSRFYQDHDVGGEEVAVTNLLHDLPSGTNIAHFRHVKDFHDGLCLACCAVGLLRWPGFASASKFGKKEQMAACINGNTPAYSIRTSSNLLETLWLSWPSSSPVNGDAPVWKGADEASPPGFLKNMTWRSRSILLAPQDIHSGCCCYCSKPTDYLIKEIIFRPGWPRPSKEPWTDDPQLLWVENKDNRGKVKRIIPKWPGPNEALEGHAAIWRSVLQGLLQYPVVNQTVPTQFHTTLVGASQALYKHAETHIVDMPGLDSNITQDLLNELNWLRELSWKTTSARTIDWEKRPKGHVVIDALCSTAGKGQAIRSGLCVFSFLAEKELEEAFERLIQDLASADPADTDSHAQWLGNWTEEVREIIYRNVREVIGFTTTGSPLHRREARHQANEAVRKLFLMKGAK
jgi:hypothetical protein